MQPEEAPKTGLTAGADFGLKDFLTLSTGDKIAAPQPLKSELRKLRKAQRVLSRKQKGSKARKRARLDVARIHQKVANVRNDWQWKQACMLATVFDLLVFETLNLKAMHRLWGRKVGDLGFADFLLKAQCDGKEARARSGQDRLLGANDKNLPLMWASSGHAAQYANVCLRWLRKCGMPRRERGI
jgi:transposase